MRRRCAQHCVPAYAVTSYLLSLFALAIALLPPSSPRAAVLLYSITPETREPAHRLQLRRRTHSTRTECARLRLRGAFSRSLVNDAPTNSRRYAPSLSVSLSVYVYTARSSARVFRRLPSLPEALSRPGKRLRDGLIFV